jgi:hypothetical protein
MEGVAIYRADCANGRINKSKEVFSDDTHMDGREGRRRAGIVESL